MRRFYVTLLFLHFAAACRVLSPEAGSPANELIPAPRNIGICGRGLVSPAEISVDRDVPADWNDERYTIEITPERILIRAKTDRGEVWARRTLRQLDDGSGRYPRLRIDDWPEFPIRGFLWDDGRNFAGTETIRHWLDMMSACKLNLFQWHLTDHPAWRIECRCHPELNDPRYQRPGRDEGRFYTYDEIRDIIAYAAQAGITVVPELDMPGHSTYFTAAFGCTMDSEKGRRILGDCIAEFCSEIPAELCPIIHIGSDEVRIGDPDGFMRWSQELLRSFGRQTMVWDPGLPADSLSIRQIWRDGSPDDSQTVTDTPFVDSSMGYLNYYDPLLFPAKMFFHTPCYTGRADETALGGILCMWNDVRADDKRRTGHHNGLAAGMLAFAERFWNGGITADIYTGTIMPPQASPQMERFEEFQQRIAAHKRRLWPEELSYWQPIHSPEWEVELRTADSTYRFTASGDILDLDALCRRYSIPAALDVECRISRNIESSHDTVRRYLIGFDSPARSNRISGGIPAPGEWPCDGYILVNGEPVSPPRWREPGSYAFHFNTWARPEEELPYTDEQLYWMNPPLDVKLHRGTNRIEMGVKRSFRGQRFHIALVEQPSAEKKQK